MEVLSKLTIGSNDLELVNGWKSNQALHSSYGTHIEKLSVELKDLQVKQITVVKERAAIVASSFVGKRVVLAGQILLPASRRTISGEDWWRIYDADFIDPITENISDEVSIITKVVEVGRDQESDPNITQLSPYSDCYAIEITSPKYGPNNLTHLNMIGAVGLFGAGSQYRGAEIITIVR